MSILRMEGCEITNYVYGTLEEDKKKGEKVQKREKKKGRKENEW